MQQPGASAKVAIATTYIRHQGGGGSDPHLVRCDDGIDYVVKFKKNPQGTRILANEWVSTSIGHLVGAPCPDCSLIQIGADFIERAQIRYNGMAPPAGLHFGSRYVSDPTRPCFPNPTPAHVGRFVNKAQIANLVLLDSMVGNTDRKNEHILFHEVTGGLRFWAVDLGHSLGVVSGWKTLKPSHVGEALVAPVMADFLEDRAVLDSALDIMERSVTKDAVDQITRSAPLAEWEIGADEAHALSSYLMEQKTQMRARVEAHLGQFPKLAVKK